MIDWRGYRAGCDPVFADAVDALLKPSKYSFVVTRGKATYEEQEALYKVSQAGGPTAAPPGKSAHNYGLAIDVAVDSDPTRPGLQPDWNTKALAWVWLTTTVNASAKLNTLWYIGDFGHIQWKDWKKRAGVTSQPSQVIADYKGAALTVLVLVLLIAAASEA